MFERALIGICQKMHIKSLRRGGSVRFKKKTRLLHLGFQGLKTSKNQLIRSFLPHGRLMVNIIISSPLHYRGRKRVLKTGMTLFWTSVVGCTTSFDWAPDKLSETFFGKVEFWLVILFSISDRLFYLLFRKMIAYFIFFLNVEEQVVQKCASSVVKGLIYQTSKRVKAFSLFNIPGNHLFFKFLMTLVRNSYKSKSN